MQDAPKISGSKRFRLRPTLAPNTLQVGVLEQPSQTPVPRVLFSQGSTSGTSEEAGRKPPHAEPVRGASPTELVSRKLQVRSQPCPGACWLVWQALAHSEQVGRGLPEATEPVRSPLPTLPESLRARPRRQALTPGRGSWVGVLYTAGMCPLIILGAHFPPPPISLRHPWTVAAAGLALVPALGFHDCAVFSKCQLRRGQGREEFGDLFSLGIQKQQQTK